MTKEQKPNSGVKKKLTPQQRKIRLQQVIMAVIGIVVILAMILALAVNY